MQDLEDQSKSDSKSDEEDTDTRETTQDDSSEGDATAITIICAASIWILCAGVGLFGVLSKRPVFVTAYTAVSIPIFVLAFVLGIIIVSYYGAGAILACVVLFCNIMVLQVWKIYAGVQFRDQ